MPARSGGHKDHARVTPRRVEREEAGLADRVILGVDAQERAADVGQVAAARAVSVVVL